MAEYIRLQRLKKLGITTSLDAIDCVTEKIFVFISEVFDELEAKSAKERRKKR